MPQITPSLINDLHGRTGQPVLECKKALVESDGHLGKAIDWFRQRGVFPVLRNASEGRIAVLQNKNGRVGTYNDLDGRIGVLLSITGKISEEMLKDLCLHVARHDPPAAALTRDRLPTEIAASPDAGARALMEQKFIKDPAKTIAQLIEQCNCSLVEFVRVEVGT